MVSGIARLAKQESLASAFSSHFNFAINVD